MHCTEMYNAFFMPKRKIYCKYCMKAQMHWSLPAWHYVCMKSGDPVIIELDECDTCDEYEPREE